MLHARLVIYFRSLLIGLSCCTYSGVEECIEHRPQFINLKDEEGATPLLLAIAHDHCHVASYLMEKVNIHIIDTLVYTT